MPHLGQERGKGVRFREVKEDYTPIELEREV